MRLIYITVKLLYPKVDTPTDVFTNFEAGRIVLEGTPNETDGAVRREISPFLGRSIYRSELMTN